MDCSTPGLPVHHHLPELSQVMSIASVMPSNHLILCHPLLLPPSIFPSLRVFSSESVLGIRWPKYFLCLKFFTMQRPVTLSSKCWASVSRGILGSCWSWHRLWKQDTFSHGKQPYRWWRDIVAALWNLTAICFSVVLFGSTSVSYMLEPAPRGPAEHAEALSS